MHQNHEKDMALHRKCREQISVIITSVPSRRYNCALISAPASARAASGAAPAALADPFAAALADPFAVALAEPFAAALVDPSLVALADPVPRTVAHSLGFVSGIAPTLAWAAAAPGAANVIGVGTADICR